MESRRGLSNGLDWRDVSQAIVNLEAVLGGTIKVIMVVEKRGSSWDLVIVAMREWKEMETPDPQPSVSVSVSCRAARFTELEAACMSALHQLDLACWDKGAYVPSKDWA